MNPILKDTLAFFLGSQPAWYYLAGFIIAIASAFLSIYMVWRKRRNSPEKIGTNLEKFHLGYFIADNILRFIASIIVLYFVLRSIDLSQSPILMLGAGFGVCLTSDQFIQYFMDNSNLVNKFFSTANKSKFITPKSDDSQ